MSDYSVEAVSVNKTFGRRLIFKNLNFKKEKCGTFGISGPNGSGKTTLVKITAGLISPSEGRVIHKHSGIEIRPEELHNYIGFVSPYLILYDEFTARENLGHFSRIRNIDIDEKWLGFLFDQFNLSDRQNDIVKTYSSGMLQRLKFIFAFIHKPQLIILDEPTSNLDDAGKKAVYDLVKNESREKIFIIASNEKSDIDLCDEKIFLEKYKTT